MALTAMVLALAIPVAAQLEFGNISDAPIELEADSAEISHNQRKVVYSGNVVITQAEQQLTGDVATASYTSDNIIEHTRITGKPAVWKLQKTASTTYSGKASSIDYFVAENRLLLTGNAEVETTSGIITGNRIEYNTITGDARVISDTNTDDRVRVIFNPDAGGNEPQ